MAIAEEPCLFQYFLFLVKDKGKLNNPAIDEAQKLWDSICKTFSIDLKKPRIITIVQRSNEEIYHDKRVKHLAKFKTQDNVVLGKQILAHDIIVICIVINTKAGLETNEPEKEWSKQLEINDLTYDLNYAYNIISVLQTITYEPIVVANRVRDKLELFCCEKIDSSLLDFGTLWRYGPGFRYLLTIDKLHEKMANKFLANNLAYLLTLQSKIHKHYSLSVKLYKDISKIEEMISNLESNLTKIDSVSELDDKKRRIRALNKKATNNLTYLKDCGNNIQSNVKNYKYTIQKMTLETENDEIFSNDLELFREHIDNIFSWARVCDNSVERINKMSKDQQVYINEQIEKLKKRKILMRTTMEQPEPKKSRFAIALEWGNSYIINENELLKSLNIFESIINLGIPGLCITRTHPDKLKKNPKFKDVDIKWLSKDIVDPCIPPLPEKISHEISNYFRNNHKSVLLLDGLEYIKTNNKQTRVIKFIDHLKDLAVMYKTTIIMPVYYKAFSSDEIALLMKNMVDLTNLEPNYKKLKDE